MSTPTPKNSNRTPHRSAALVSSGVSQERPEPLTYARLVELLELSIKSAGAIARLDAEAGVAGPTERFASELRCGFQPNNWGTDIGQVAVAATALQTNKATKGTPCPSISVLVDDVLQAVVQECVQRRVTLMENRIAEMCATHDAAQTAAPTFRRRPLRL
ncbi:MAG: hypothetical protein H0U56_09090 [Methylibium sp.]|nr:hypothetical protein [Methylibium sp.]MBA3589077.1 hypothetical protein [Methylibium sp.]